MLYFGRQIFIPLALAVVLSFLLSPFVALLERLRLRRIPSVLTVLVLCFVLAGGVGWILANQLLEITANIGDYKINLVDKIHTLRAPNNGSFSQATATVRELNKELAAAPAEAAAGRSAHEANRSTPPARPIAVQVTAPPSNLLQDLSALLGPLAIPVETTFIVVIFTAFTLIKREDLRNRLIRLGGQGQLHVMTQALDDASRRLSHLLWLQFAVNGCYGTLFGAGLYFIGVPHAFLWGALGALLRFVPYIGTWIATAFPVALALAVFPGWKHALLTFGLFLILDLIIANVVEPWLYGAHTGVSSLAILVAAVFWTMLWGPAGLILSTPLTLCLMLAGRYVPRLGFLEVVLGDEPVLKPEEQFYQRLLAMDPDEARNIAEDHLRDKSLENLYEAVLIPALSLAEQDRHMDAVDDRISETLSQNTRELIEELGDRFEHEVSDPKNVEVGKANGEANHPFRPAGIICVPARDEADELVGIMLAQLLRLSGNYAIHIPIGTVNDMMDQVAQGEYRIVCVSALPPFAVGQARSLCKRLRSRFPELKIIVGLWDFAGGFPKAAERIGTGVTDAVATTLSEALMQVRGLAPSVLVDASNTKIFDAPQRSHGNGREQIQSGLLSDSIEK
jgi:predicted PurR-regulated permease PerM